MDGTYDHSQVDGMELIAESCVSTSTRATLEYDLTLLEPPAHVQEVDQTTESSVTESKVVHWEPEVA